MADSDLIDEAMEAFELAEEAEQDNRVSYVEDIRFARLSEQWDFVTRRAREREGRPCLTMNKMPTFIRQVVNDSRQNRPSISVHPVDSGADVKTAEVITGLIRNIETQSNADLAQDTAIDCAVSGGFGYFRINVDYARDDTFEKDIVIRAIPNPLAVYGDPYSTCSDSSDWKTAFIVERLTEKEFKRKYKHARHADFTPTGRWSDCGPPWRDGKHVQIAEWWTREEVTKKIVALSSGEIMPLDDFVRRSAEIYQAGVTPVGEPRLVKSYKVTQRVISGVEVLETVAWAGTYIPIIPVYGEEVNVEGKRHLRSLIRDAKDSQRMFNYWRTTSTEMVALAPRIPFIGRQGAFETDAAKWATANSASHPFIEYDGPERPERQPFSGVPAGVIQEALNATDDMKAITGLYDASLGARSNETSGVAINARKREGDVSTFHFMDNLTRSIRHAGKVLLDLIPKVYNTERIIRVLGPDSVPVSVKGPDGDAPHRITDADGKHLPDEGVFNLTIGKYDLVVKSGPSFTSRREEAAAQMMDFVRALPAAAPVIGDLLVKNLDWPDADETAKRLRSLLPPSAHGDEAAQSPEAQQAQQALRAMQEHLGQLSAKLGEMTTDRSLESRKLDIAAYDAETKRISAVGGGMNEQQVQAIIQQMVADTLNQHGLEMPEPPGMPAEAEHAPMEQGYPDPGAVPAEALA